MLERIYKLQPNRTMALRGFDNLGASAALHSVTSNSFTVSGAFRDAADFCVLMLWDVDDFYGHPSIKYLPDSNFAGLVLTFDVQYTGLQPLDSNKFPTIDWPYLDGRDINDNPIKVNLFSPLPTQTGVTHTQVGGSYTAASATFTVVDNGLQPFDRVTLWYENFAFDHTVAAGETVTDVVTDLVNQIKGAAYPVGEIGLTATATGNQITVTASKPGVDGNMIRLYALSKQSNPPNPPTLSITPDAANLSGGDSNAIWRFTVDFSALGWTDLRQLWLTFAPPLANSAAYTGGDWEAVFTNWTLTGPEAVKALQVAGMNSVRVYQDSAACTYSGKWCQVTNFYNHGFARRGYTVGSTARIRYSCAVPHDLYIGTLLASDAGEAGIQLDADTETDLDCVLNTDTVITRRKVRSNVPAGSHVVTIVLKLGAYVDFNFLEAAVPSDIPAPLPARANLSPALDFDTDHTYKLPPARVLWMLNQLGFSGPINEYLGVFWWNQRIPVKGTVPVFTITFGGTWAGGDSIFLDIGPPGIHGSIDRSDPKAVSTISKSVFPADTLDTIAAHFAAFINEAFSGIWASSSGGVLTVTCRSAGYSFAMEESTDSTKLTSTLNGTIGFSGSLTGGIIPEWYVDPTQSPTINTGVRAWHTDFYTQCQVAGLTVVTSISMELVNPPDSFPALFHDGTPVSTATDFGGLNSMHCAIGGPVLDFQKSVLSDVAALQVAAGLTPFLQLGEFLWWFSASKEATPTMAYYDAQTQAAASTSLGRALYVFTDPNNDPTVNSSADATFLRNRLRDHAATLITSLRTTYPTARFEILLPLDVNYPQPAGPVGAQVGGQLNHFVNIPPEWLSPATAGFDFLKIEALAFGSTMRNMDLAKNAIGFALQTSWPGPNRRYLVPVFGTASPWAKEVGMAFLAGYGVVNLWAFDHICLYGWNITANGLAGMVRSSFQA